MKRLTIALILIFGAAFTIGSMPALAQFSGPTPLTLINGWTNAPNAFTPFNTSIATVEEVAGIVQFRGGIENAQGSTNQFPFVLPAALSPTTDVFIPVTLLCLGFNETGRLHIEPNGTVIVERKGPLTPCFASLDGASFALTDTGFTQLAPIHGWSNAPFSTSNAAVQNINGIVHFKGAISTSPNNSNLEPFTLPVGFTPATDVFIPVDLCGANTGRLHITPGGTVDINVPSGAAASNPAQCFTSLDGAWFAATDTGFTQLAPINNWMNAPFSTSNAAAANAYGIVYFKGAVSSGTSSVVTTLPVAFRPITDVFIPVDLCGANDGWIQIAAGSGEVTINDPTASAPCFLSLDGVSFVQ
ncbi:MAG TPA: hypothetical protein VKZ53_02910 [Candidatus Angelobacter sp.]|nr:hypothetical protein [Candidatus Angelobacter sp.]